MRATPTFSREWKKKPMIKLQRRLEDALKENVMNQQPFLRATLFIDSNHN
jgi:hypothetical protein